MIKILFINAINPESEIETRYTPLGIPYLSASLNNSFPVDTFEIRLVDNDIEKNIKSFRPDIVGITSVSQNFNYAIKHANLAHRWGLPTIVGGIHISMIPESLTEDMDVGCIGEGELTIIDLMKVFLEHKRFCSDELQKIDGIVFWKNGKRIETPHRTAIRRMAQIIPHPDRTLEGPVKHAYVFSSRGCPYRCVFCASSRYWKQVRFFPPNMFSQRLRTL